MSGAQMTKLLTSTSTENTNNSTVKISAAQQKMSQLEKKQLQKQARSILRKVPMFRRAPAALVDQLIPALVRWTVPAGTLIIREGEQGNTMYLVLNGEVQVSPRDHSIVYTKMLRGDFFGEWAIVSGEIRSADVLANTDVDVLALNREGWDKVIMGLTRSIP